MHVTTHVWLVDPPGDSVMPDASTVALALVLRIPFAVYLALNELLLNQCFDL
jgi:hypothetical protein